MIVTPLGPMPAAAQPAAGIAKAGPDELADRVAAAVRGVAGVADLHPGAFGEVATYLPGRRVKGVQLRTDHCAVHVVLYWGAAVLETADRVRTAVLPLVATRVDVTIEDVTTESLKA